MKVFSLFDDKSQIQRAEEKLVKKYKIDIEGMCEYARKQKSNLNIEEGAETK